MINQAACVFCAGGAIHINHPLLFSVHHIISSGINGKMGNYFPVIYFVSQKRSVWISSVKWILPLSVVYFTETGAVDKFCVKSMMKMANLLHRICR
jgi:hypothetical protein